MKKHLYASGTELSLNELATIAAGKDGEEFAVGHENSGKQVGVMTRKELLGFYNELGIGYCILNNDARLTLGWFARGIPFELKTKG